VRADSRVRVPSFMSTWRDPFRADNGRNATVGKGREVGAGGGDGAGVKYGFTDKMSHSTKCGKIKGISAADLVSILIDLQIGEIRMTGIT
jgi:hypothetical protein